MIVDPPQVLHKNTETENFSTWISPITGALTTTECTLFNSQYLQNIFQMSTALPLSDVLLAGPRGPGSFSNSASRK